MIENQKEFIAHRRKLDSKNQTLEEHLLAVAARSRLFANKIGLARAGELIGLLHDFGKYSNEFQNYIKSATGQLNPDMDEDYVDYKDQKGKIDHSTAGAQWVWQRLSKYGLKGQGQFCAQILALCIVSHHSGLIDCLNPEGLDTFSKRINKSDQKTNFIESCGNAHQVILEKAEQLSAKELIPEMLRLIDPLKLNSKGDIIANFYLGFFARFLFSCLIDADRIDSAGFENPDYLKIQNRKIDWNLAIERFERRLAQFKFDNPIDIIRRKISQDCFMKSKAKPGIYTLTVPTGGGKTLASLRFALHHVSEHKLDRVIYVIPYTSIIEQNAEAIRNLLEAEGDEFPWVLEHHSNLEPEKQSWHSKLASDNWESPIILTTMVQFLEVLFDRGARSVRRLHQLANSVLIFDEIQTLPIKCVHLFCNAINFLVENKHAPTTVVLCTATQPLLNRLKTPEKGQLYIPKENELVEDVDRLFKDLKRVEIVNMCRVDGWKVDEVSQFALAEFRVKNSCLVIANTKAWALNLYMLCQKEISKESIFHLSTYQCPAHRKKLLGEIRERLQNGLPTLCISTQLIEAGVDIDFASVIRFMAGLDSIAQAAGRCNRNGNLRDEHGKIVKGTVYVLNPSQENLDLLVEIRIGQEITRRVFQDLRDKDILNPEQMELYFNYYFFNRASSMDYPLSAKQIGRDDTLLNLLSNNSKNIGLIDRKGKFPLLQQSFMSAARIFEVIDAPNKAIIVPYEYGREIIIELCAIAREFNPGRYYELLKEAQKYSVNIYPYLYEKLCKEGAIYEIGCEGVFYLDERYYSDQFGLSSGPINKASLMIVAEEQFE